MAIPKDVKEEFKALKNACNEFMNSKLILIEKSISNILKTIAKGGQIYNCLAEEIVGYNFSAEYESVLRSGSFDLVLSENKMVPFAFHLLNEMDNGNIDIFGFIKQIFGEDNQKAYIDFGAIVIKNFESGIEELLEVRFAENEVEVEEDPEQQNPMLDEAFLDRIKFVIENIMNGLSDKKLLKHKLRGDINTLCVSILLCIAHAEDIGLLGLVLGLKHMLKKIKMFKNDIKELELIIDAFNQL